MSAYPDNIKELVKTVLVNLYPEVDDSGKPYLPYEASFEVIADALMAAHVELEEVGVAEDAGDFIDISINDDLRWVEGEKLYRKASS